MAMMIMLRSQTVAFLSGHSVRFVKNKPVFVPPNAVDEAMRMGAAIADPDDDSPKLVDHETEQAKLRAKVEAAVRQVQTKNDPTEFNAHSQPRVDVVNAITSQAIFKAADIAAATKAIREEDEEARRQELDDALADSKD